MVRTASQRRSLSSNSNNNDLMQIDNVSISRKTKFRYILARCDNYEKQLSDLLQSLSLYTRRTAKLRDSGDCVSDSFSTLAASEAVNPAFKRATIELSKTIRSIQDHRDSEVLYFEEKLLTSLSQYGENLQKQKERIRAAVPKVLDSDKNRNTIWIGGGGSSSGSTYQASTSSQNRRRSQSADRIERISKEERNLQRQVQLYEFQKNLVLKKLILRFLLIELRLTIKSFNNLTITYQNILKDFSPQSDLKIFNEFFNFRTIKKSLLNEIQDDISDFDSANDDDDEDDDDEEEEGEEEEKNDEQQESGLEENLNSVDDITEAPDDEDDNSESWKSESVSSSTQSTLRRFNSTPEIEINKQTIKQNQNQNEFGRKKEIQPINKNDLLMKSINDKINLRSLPKKRTSNKPHSDDDNQEDETDSDEEQKQTNNKRRPNSSRPGSIHSIRKYK